MKRTITTIAIAVTVTQPLIAQERPDLGYTSSASAVAERGTAVMAGLRVPLGVWRERRGANQRVRIDLVAGPSFRLIDGGQLQQANVINGDGLRLSFVPGHSTRLSLNGRSIATRYASLNAAEADGETGESGGISTLAIVGGALLVGLGVAYLGFEDAVDCTENGQYVCE